MKTMSACFAVLLRLRASAAWYIGLSSSHWCRIWCYRGWTIAMQCWLFDIPLHLARRLQSAMNVATRLIFVSSKCDLIMPLLHQLHWLKVPWQIDYKLVVLVYKCIHGLAASYLADELHHPAESEFRRHLCSASSYELSIPHTRLSTYGD